MSDLSLRYTSAIAVAARFLEDRGVDAEELTAAARLRELLALSSPRAPESTPTEGDPCRMLREMEAAIAACLNETDERPDYPRLYAVREKVRAYLSSREQPQEKT